VKKLYFNDVEEVVESRCLRKLIDDTCLWIERDLPGSGFPNTALKSILEDCGWRDNPESLKIIDGRRYQYKGYLKRIAVEANLVYYEYLWEGLFRLLVRYGAAVA